MADLENQATLISTVHLLQVSLVWVPHDPPGGAAVTVLMKRQVGGWKFEKTQRNQIKPITLYPSIKLPPARCEAPPDQDLY